MNGSRHSVYSQAIIIHLTMRAGVLIGLIHHMIHFSYHIVSKKKWCVVIWSEWESISLFTINKSVVIRPFYRSDFTILLKYTRYWL